MQQRLVSQLKQTNQQFDFFGMGGTLMKKEGVELIEDVKKLIGDDGIFEILAKLPFSIQKLYLS